METSSPPAMAPGGLTRVESPPEKMLPPSSRLSPTKRSRADSKSTKPLFPRSKSDLTMASLPNLAEVPTSSSEVSLAQSTRSASVAQLREEKSGSLAKSLFNRSSRLLQKRKSSNKLRSTDGSTGRNEGIARDGHDVRNRRLSKHMRVESAESRWRPTISEPYNFQHLTHTGPTQAKTLKSASHRDLVSEFSAIRASQAPQPGLKGIKAEDIQASFSPDTSSFASPITSLESSAESRPTSPFGSPVGTDEGRSLRTSKSVDSFTRVAVKSFSSPKPPISPPLRRSSRVPRMSPSISVNPNSIVLESPTIPDVITPTSNNSSPNSGFNIRSSFSPSASNTLTESPRLDSGEIAQAVTTPDDSAYVFISHPRSGSNLALADVPEEEEDGPKPETNDGERPHTLRHAKSFPSTRGLPKPVKERLPWSTPQLDGDQWASAPNPDHPALHQQDQVAPAPWRNSWEDDIDYCYEHAMEAEGLEWDESSADENIWMQQDTNTSSTPTPALHQLEEAQASINPYIDSSTSERGDSTSATSSSVSIPGLVTPSEAPPQFHLPYRDSTISRGPVYPLSPVFLVPKEYSPRVTHEESYAQNIPDTDGFKQPQPAFPYYPQGLRLDVDFRREYNSPRSSGSPISKTTSRESLRTSKSSAANSKHRHSSSIGSVPELVPSSHSLYAPSSTSGRPMTACSVVTSDAFLIQRAEEHEPEAPAPLVPTPLEIKPQINTFIALHPPPSKPLPPISQPSTSASGPAPAVLPPISAPPVTTIFSARNRANSDATRGFSDLSLIGEPKLKSRLRAGSVAAGPGAFPTASSAGRARGHRTSYSLFPQGSMSSMREMAMSPSPMMERGRGY